jgi:hypothetical protein
MIEIGVGGSGGVRVVLASPDEREWCCGVGSLRWPRVMLARPDD